MTDFILLHPFDFQDFVRRALNEDEGKGDLTSLSVIPPEQDGKMKLLVKENGIIAGVEAAKMIFEYIEPRARLKVYWRDGTPVSKGDVVFTVNGNYRKLLLAERLVLNVMQRMSGIATKTRALQTICEGTKAKVCDTRKTTPGFRYFEKWAVHLGGGANHRFGLYDMILIKDNHVDVAGGISKAIFSANTYLKKNKSNIPIEIETRSLKEVKEVLKTGMVQRILLDNFSAADTRKAVKRINGLFETESSGGITEKNIRLYAECGVDYISVGALTHHVSSLDMSLKVESL